MKTYRVLSDNKRIEEDDAAMKSHTAYQKRPVNGLTIFDILHLAYQRYRTFQPFSAK
jgi:hypothetical protein